MMMETERPRAFGRGEAVLQWPNGKIMCSETSYTFTGR